MQPGNVLDFWLGPLDEDGAASAENAKRWFTKDSAFDESIRQRFGALHGMLGEGSVPEGWDSLEGRVARVIVLDQFPRNMFRGTGRMYETDPMALEQSKDLRPALASLGTHHAVFSIMPFMHAESVEAQDECIRLFNELASDSNRSEKARAAFEGNLKYARSHRDVVARFGRFPHRNALLGRTNTEEEKKYLEDPKAGW